MNLRRSVTLGLVSFVLSTSFSAVFAGGSLAQGAPTVSVVTLQVVPGPEGDKVITPRGMVVPLPGAGVDGNVVQVYVGSQGGYWYVDKNGNTVDLTAAVQQLRGSASKAQTVPQYAPAPSYQTTSSSNSGLGAAGTAAAAGVGAMAGSAIANSMYYNSVPYGTPMYYPRGGSPYYVNASGNSVNVEHTTNANQNYYSHHSNNLEQQQQWYAAQQKQDSSQFQRWQSQQGDNPFVAANAQRAGSGAAQGEDGGRRRFGRRGGEDGADAQAGGRFGRRGGEDGADAQAGGRFGRRGGGDGADAQAGGRFGRRGGGQEPATAIQEQGGRFAGSAGEGRSRRGRR